MMRAVLILLLIVAHGTLGSLRSSVKETSEESDKLSLEQTEDDSETTQLKSPLKKPQTPPIPIPNFHRRRSNYDEYANERLAWLQDKILEMKNSGGTTRSKITEKKDSLSGNE